MGKIIFVDGGNVYRIKSCNCGSQRIRTYYLEEKQQMLLVKGAVAQKGFTFSVLDRTNYQFECDNCQAVLEAEVVQEEVGADCECGTCPPGPAKEDFEPVPDKLVQDVNSAGRKKFNLKNRLEGV